MSEFDDWVKRLTGLAKDLERESERGVVIIGVAMIDESLESVLKKVIGPPAPSDAPQDKLFDADWPLGSTSAKAEMAYRLAIIDEPFRRIVLKLNKIRNDFAHNPENRDFSHQPTLDQFKAIREQARANSPDLFDLVEMTLTIQADAGEVTPRYQFIAVVALVRAALHFAFLQDRRPPEPMPLLTKGKEFPAIKERLAQGAEFLRRNAELKKAVPGQREGPSESGNNPGGSAPLHRKSDAGRR